MARIHLYCNPSSLSSLTFTAATRRNNSSIKSISSVATAARQPSYVGGGWVSLLKTALHYFACNKIYWLGTEKSKDIIDPEERQFIFDCMALAINNLLGKI